MNTGSTITDNNIDQDLHVVGGGVNLWGTFILNGGTITNGGTGVYIGGGGTFLMNSGNIYGNHAHGSGGGIYLGGNGTFTMTGGTITQNSARYSGGGVYIRGGDFSKTGGTITGYESDPINGNMVTNGDNLGDAVYAADINLTIEKIKNTTAGDGVNLSFNESTGSFSGNWDN